MRSISSADPIRSDREPPACPDWCEHAPTGHGWDDSSVDTTKTCTRVVGTVERLNGPPVPITLDRFAYVDCTEVHVGVTVLTIGQNIEMTVDAAGCLRAVLGCADRLTA
jgi:hypothetical protein